MSEEKELEIDTVNLLRAVMKISSALNNLDELVYNKKYIKYGVKKAVDDWSNMISKHTNDLMKSLVEEDNVLLDDIYASFDAMDTSVQSDDINPSKRHLILFYVKLSGAINDIESMQNNRNSIYPTIIFFFTKNVIDQIDKQYTFLKELSDSDGKTINDLIGFIDETGTKIMHYGEN